MTHAPTGGPHIHPRPLGGEHGRPQVHVDEAFEFLNRSVRGRVAAVDGRVVDQHVQPAHDGMSAVHHVKDGIDVCEVDHDRVCGNTMPPHRGGDAVQLLGIGGCNGHFRARLGEREGDATANAAAGARDERPATGEREGVAHG